MSVRLNCPSCNTAFDLSAVPEHRRATCPRCGDVFPVRGDAATSAETAAPALASPAPAPISPRRSGWSIWKIAAIALAIALIGFAVGYGVYSRRPPPPCRESPRPQPLANRDSLLAKLPAECNVVFVIDAKPLVAHAAQTGKSPRDLLADTGLPARGFAVLDQLGVGLEAVDHVAGGAHIGDEGDELRLALGVAFNSSAPAPDRDTLLKRLKAKPAKSDQYAVELSGLPLSLLSVSSDGRTWLFGFGPHDLERASNTGYADHFRGVEVRDGRETAIGLRRALRAVPLDAAVWAVADDDRDWTQKPLVKLAAQFPEVKKWLPPLDGVRGGVFAVSYRETPQMFIQVRAADTATADRLRAYFRANGNGGGTDLEASFGGPLDPALVRRMLADATK